MSRAATHAVALLQDDARGGGHAAWALSQFSEVDRAENVSVQPMDNLTAPAVRSAKDKLGDALTELPELAPGLIIGALVGSAWGVWHDYRRGKGPMEGRSFWGAGGLGMVIGAFAWLYLVVG